MSKILLSNVTKMYGKVTAVDDLSLEINEGEFLTLLGPSGCGKTTTLRMIAGLEEPTDGEIQSGGSVLHSRAKGIYVPPEQRKLGFMFQSYALWPHMTVFKNISLGLESRKIPKQEIRSRVEEVLAKVQLAEYEGRYPSELSGGQQQRVALARMIAAQSDIFLMDEPLSNLDALLRVDMRSELKHLHRELGATSVYVTHDQVEALTLSDRIAVMNNGRIMQCDTPEQIYQKPKNLFVARFVGSPPINLVRGSLERDDSNLTFTTSELRIPLTDEAASRALDGRNEVIMAVRAEDISFKPESHSGESFSFSVYSVLPSGSETIVATRRGDIELTVKVSGFFRTGIDETVKLAINTERISFYDPGTEGLLY